jgi:DsbC/DsbD-like thiol-disulfide interchange protein
MRPAFLAVVLWGAMLVPAAAQPASEAVTGVALIDGWRQPDGSRLAAIEIRLAPGWHTYWRVPGDAGVPPEFDWSRSKNLAAVAYEWPRPQIFTTYGMRTLGYEERLVLPVQLIPEDPDLPMELDLDLAFGVCADICAPTRQELAVSLAPDAPPSGRAPIEAALAERARTPAEAGVAAATCRLAPAGDGFEVVAEVTFGAELGPGQVVVVEPGQPDLWIGASESRTDGRTVVARAPVQAAGGGGPVVERRTLRVTVLDPERAVDIRGCEAPA